VRRELLDDRTQRSSHDGSNLEPGT